MLVSVETIPADLTVAAVTVPAVKVDPRIERAQPSLYRFLGLAGQLALILLVIRAYRLEQFLNGYLGFFSMCCVAFGAFAIHYWLPFEWKEKFWVGASLAATALFLPLAVAAGIVLVGAAFYLVLSSRFSYRARVGVIVAGIGALMLLRGHPELVARFAYGHSFGNLWPVLGGIFMFRLIIYLYDVQEIEGRPPLVAFLSYFFILPNYFFLLFPVIDYKTMRMNYYRRDIHKVAQQGIMWMTRGIVQLLLYLIIAHVRDTLTLDGVHSFPKLVTMMFLTFMLYLHVSGQFHFSIGMLHLFGYDLPETNHKYLLSSSLTDFWRRINIYWKDFMVKIVYFPAYFWLRKKGEVQAKLTSTAMVFVVTWALHSYQAFWLRGDFIWTWPDVLFWTILGMLVVVNVWWEIRHPRRRANNSIRGRLCHAAAVVGTMALILVIWSLWNAPSLAAWADFLSWWSPRA
jgi:alginate O-acetyltransferase complex protein AlgI